MGAKPSSLPRWANVGGAIVTPGAGKLDVGWVTAERPPAQYLNWYQNLVYLWVLWLSDLFTSGGQAKGNMDLGTTAEANLAPLATYRDYLQKTRANVDHNGYRMGQVSELDEDWRAEPVKISVPLAAGIVTQGAPTINNGSWRYTAASQTFRTEVQVPQGAIITNVIVYWNQQNAANSASATLEYDGSRLSASVPGQRTRTLAGGGIGNFSVDVMNPSGSAPTYLLTKRAAATISSWLQIWIQTSAVTTSTDILDIEVTYILPPDGWDYTGVSTDQASGAGTGTNNDRFQYVDPQANLNQRGLQLLGGVVSSGSAGQSVLAGKWETFHDTNVAYAMEFMVRTGTISDATNRRQFALGIQNNNAGGLNRFVYFFNQDTTTNWQLRVVGSATADTDTGVAIAANTTYRMRLEIYGASLNSSGNVKIRAYINGTLVAETNSSTLPAADKIRPYFKAGVSAGGTTCGPYDFTLGRVRRVWNHLLTQDNL